MEDLNFFNEKYDIGSVQSDLLRVYQHYLAASSPLHVLDVGCGRGRNLLYLAAAGHQVTGIDINGGAIARINTIATEENLPATAIVHDLHDDIVSVCKIASGYDFIFSTVTLQFLQPERVPGLLQEMQILTKAGGLHCLVFPVADSRYTLPSSFRYLPKSEEVLHWYQQQGADILEYEESLGSLKRLDAEGRPTQGQFAVLLAKI